MPPYNSMDLPSAGRQPMSLAEENVEAMPMNPDTQSIHSEDHLDTEGLRTRSPSPDVYNANQRTFSNSATTSESPAQLNSCSSEDDVFQEHTVVSAMSSSAYENVSASQSEQPTVDIRALVGGSHSVDPQDIFSPAACVFVANLSQGCEDATLSAAVNQLFSRYGTVYIKIKRDLKGMPFAFCQYETQADAERALKEGNGRYILGRKCRTEPCKGNVTFVVYKKSGRKILIKEAHDLLIAFGPIASVCTLEENCREYLKIPQAMVVTFDMFDQRREVVRTLRQNPTYCVLAYDHGEVSRLAALERGSTAMIQQYRKDRRSIYLGQLPRMYTEDIIRVTVSPFGTVNDIQMKQNFMPDGSTTLYAFVEFDDEDSADKALEFFDSDAVAQYEIRAEKKKVKLPGATRSEPSGPSRWGPSTTNSNTSRHAPASAADPFSGPSPAPVSQISSVRARIQAPVGSAHSRRGGQISDTPSEESSQSMVQWQPRRRPNPIQEFENTQRVQRRGVHMPQAYSSMGRGQAQGMRSFTQPGAQQVAAQVSFRHPNTQGNIQRSRNQFYVGPIPNSQPNQVINQPLNQYTNTVHGYGRGVGSLPPSLQSDAQSARDFSTISRPDVMFGLGSMDMHPSTSQIHSHNRGSMEAPVTRADENNNIPVVGQAKAHPNTHRVDVLHTAEQLNDLGVNQEDMSSSVAESFAGSNSNPQTSSTTAQLVTESISSGDAEFTATGSDTGSEARGSPKPPTSSAPLMPAVNRVRHAGSARSYSDIAERAANRAEKAIEKNDANQRRTVSMKDNSEEGQADQSSGDPDDANASHSGQARAAQPPGDAIIVANGASTTPAAVAPRNVSIPTAPAAMSAHAGFSQQYPPMGDHGMHMPGFFPPHMTQQNPPQFMTCVTHRMNPGSPYGVSNAIPVPNTMGQGLMAPNMMQYGMQQHLMHQQAMHQQAMQHPMQQQPMSYGYNHYLYTQQPVFPGSPYGPIGPIVNPMGHHPGNPGNNSQNNEAGPQFN